VPTPKPYVREFEVTVDADRTARSELGGSSLSAEDAWTAEHLLLTALLRCTLTSLDFYARRAGVGVTGSGHAHGTVAKRESDGRYAFVDLEARYAVDLADLPEREALLTLLDRAESGCFVGNSLVEKPRYHWTVNGEEIR
jgi:organic hydroperoxide reductase OsmC/OhrA